MKHPFQTERFIGCDPVRWAHRLSVFEQFDIRALTARPMLAPGHVESSLTESIQAGQIVKAWRDEDDEDEDTDIWGDPIPSMRMEGDIAVIPIQGMIATGYPTFFRKFGVVDLDRVAEDVEEALANQNCRALAFDVDSPGGTLRALPEFAALVASSSKPAAARIEGLGCSAAYFAIAGCRIISAAPSAELVNIGVYQVNWDLTRAFEAFGYRVEVFKSGKYKAAGYPGTALSDDQKAEIQDTVDSLGKMFRDHVAQYRASADVANMQGQTFLGGRACELGFADDNSPNFAAFLQGFRAYLDAQ